VWRSVCVAKQGGLSSGFEQAGLLLNFLSHYTLPTNTMANASLNIEASEDVEMQDSLTPTMAELAARPDAVSLREAALRTLKRKPRPPQAPTPSTDKRPRPSVRAPPPRDAHLDYGSADSAATEVREEGEIEEGEVTPPKASAPLPVPPRPASRWLQTSSKTAVTNDHPPPVVPALNLSFFGVDEKHVRPGLASKPRLSCSRHCGLTKMPSGPSSIRCCEGCCS
jgi:hypothetical protein